MGELPRGWAKAKIADIFESAGGGTPKRGTAAFWNGKIPWLSSGDIKLDRIETASESITRAGLENSTARLCRPGSLVVVVRSGILKRTLPVAVLGKRAAINQDIKCFDSRNDLLNRWFLLALRARTREILAQNREGTTVQSVKHATLLDFELPIPPGGEQDRIVSRIEELLGKVEACQKRLESVPLILKQFRQSVLAAACSGRLTVDWRREHPSVEPVAKTLERNGIRFAAESEDVESEELLPPTWLRTTLRTFGPSFQNGISKRRSASGKPTVVLRLADVDGYTYGAVTPREIRLTSEEIKKYSLRPSDVLVVRVNGSARIVGRFLYHAKPGPWAYCDHFIRLRSDENLIDAHFLSFVAAIPASRTYVRRNMVSSAGQNTVSQETLFAMPLAVPPIEEQREIVRRVQALFKVADQIEFRYRAARVGVDQIAQSILAKAFRGELVRQDPKDEPASKLLERIRAGSDTKKKRGAPLITPVVRR